jgi:hypothetical protein
MGVGVLVQAAGIRVDQKRTVSPLRPKRLKQAIQQEIKDRRLSANGPFGDVAERRTVEKQKHSHMSLMK